MCKYFEPYECHGEKVKHVNVKTRKGEENTLNQVVFIFTDLNPQNMHGI